MKPGGVETGAYVTESEDVGVSAKRVGQTSRRCRTAVVFVVSSKKGSAFKRIVTGAIPSGITQVGGPMDRVRDEGGPVRRTFLTRTTTISTPIVALPAVLMSPRAKVSLPDASIGAAMMSAGQLLHDRRGQSEEQARLREGLRRQRDWS